MSTKPTIANDKPKKQRSAEHQAATAAIELARIDASIVRARETVAQKERERDALVNALSLDVRHIVEAMRGARDSR